MDDGGRQGAEAGAAPGSDLLPGARPPEPDPAPHPAQHGYDGAFGDDLDPGPAAPPGRRGRAQGRRERRGGLWAFLIVMFGAIALAGVALSMVGRPVTLPVWAVAEAEARLNRALDAAVPGQVDLSLGGATVTVAGDGTPTLALTDLRLLQPGGEAVVTLPEAQVTLALSSLWSGSPQVTSVRLAGARVELRRLPDGRLDLAFGGGFAFRFDNAADLLDAADAAAARPALAALERVEAEALTLRLEDQRAGRVFEMGDGRVLIERRPEGLAAEVGATLLGGDRAARATATLVTEAASPAARATVRVEGVRAADLASQAAPLAWLALLDASASGEVVSALGPDGALSELSARLDIGQGAVRPGEGAPPVPFDRVALAARFEPLRERLHLTGLTIDSPTLKLAAEGHADLPGVTAGLPGVVLAQVALSSLTVDPEGVFENPAVFTGGAIDLRLTLDPFRLEIGQLVLLDGDRRGVLRGEVSAGPAGWTVGFDFGIDAISSERLLALWPLRLIDRTRTWFAANVQEGELFDVKGAVRLVPGEEPRISLAYDYQGADVRFLRTLPPIEGGQGYAVLEGTAYTLVVDRGQVRAPQGGAVDMAGSVFAIADILKRPARADLTLRTKGPLEATLALLDEPPFRFLSKAGQPVALGQGEAEAVARIDLPLAGPVAFGDVDWQMEGRVRGFASEVLVPGRRLEAAELTVTASPWELVIAGPGTLSGVPFEASYRQPLGPGAAGARIEGTVELSSATVERLDLGLPAGMVSGRGSGEIVVRLARGEAPRLRLTSGLRGVGLTIPELGWAKGRNAGGRLTIEAVLTAPARVERLALDAAGLRAEGTIRLRPGGGLERASFQRVRLDGWLDAQVTLTGRGARNPGVSITGGTVDLRGMAARGDTGRGGTEMEVALDTVRVSDGIALTGVRGQFSTRGGFNGGFNARVNGAAAVTGTVAPSDHGAALRLVSDDAGGVLSAAGIFPNARGGRLEMRLVPRAEGGYAGQAEAENVRVRNVPVLAELLNAISVIGLLEQLNGQGLQFGRADALFTLTGAGVQLREATAVGASMGVSMSGVYRFAGSTLDLQGTISPFYLVNAVGGIFAARRGEGLFGFTYRITGTAADPRVAVNPLSIFTPGMFREIFRQPPPKITSDE